MLAAGRVADALDDYERSVPLVHPPNPRYEVHWDEDFHTAVTKVNVENLGQRIRPGQFVTVTVNIRPPHNVVEIPDDAPTPALPADDTHAEPAEDTPTHDSCSKRLPLLADSAASEKATGRAE
jgi:hypothetical protein